MKYNFLLSIILFLLLSNIFIEANEIEATTQYYQVEKIKTSNGKFLEKQIIAGPPRPPLGITRTTVNIPVPTSVEGIKILQVPTYKWSFGCSATAAAMIAAYYDRTNYPDIYTGPTNDGIMPMDNSVWPNWIDDSGDIRAQCPLSATHLGLDDREVKGHVDDYWIQYGSLDNDPYYNHWTEHKHNSCTADFMKTNQTTKYGNFDGATAFYDYSDTCIPLTSTDMERFGINNLDGGYGFKLFFESRGYKVKLQYNQNIDSNCNSGGFTFAQYKAEINKGHPVLINLAGHSVVGIGYNNSNQTVYLNDTWDYSIHSMTWGGSYAGMKQLSVSIINLKAPKISSNKFSIIPQLYMLLMSN